MKQIILTLLHKIGFIRLWCYFHRHKIIILMLHGVIDEELDTEWEPLRDRIKTKGLKSTLELAKKYLNFVSLDEVHAMLNGEKALKENVCVVTFDDGQLNNLTCAIPVLSALSIPCVLYPSTKAIDEQNAYWFDRLDYAIQQPGLHDTFVKLDDQEFYVDQGTREKLHKSLAIIINSLKHKYIKDSVFQEKINQLCDQLELRTGKSISQLKNRDPLSAVMNWDEIKTCGESVDILVGSHTVNHTRLSLADKETIKKELIESKQIIESHTAKPCRHFCYPNGDWNAETKRLVQSAGYVTAVTTDNGFNDLSSNVYELKRISFPGTGSALYGLFAVIGVFAKYAKAKSRFFRVKSRLF